MSENEHTINALIRKRAEIAGVIENLQNQIRQAAVDLDNVESTLRLFAPEIDMNGLGPRRVPPAHHAFHGEVTRIVLGTLRTASGPLSTTEITRRVMVERMLNTEDRSLCLIMSRRVGACLNHWKRKGTVKAMRGPGQVYLWEAARD